VTTAPALERRTFSVSRAADFLEPRALETQTGQPRQRFGDVVIKELIDNSLDACETAGVPPQIDVTRETGAQVQRITITDNGQGIPAGTVERILDFTTYTSDKALYRSPTRGLQGNALKTILGIPHAFGLTEPVTIEACGTRHVVTLSLDPARNLRVRYRSQESQRTAGTSITVPLPADLDVNADGWVAGYALVNPHATFTVVERAHRDEPGDPEIYKATAQDGWRKPVPTERTSAWWYSGAEFAALACSKAAAGDDLPIGMFIREFRDLTGTGKASQLAAAAPAIRRLSDFADHVAEAGTLLAAMKRASKVPQAAYLGRVAAEHYEELLDRLFGVERFWYKHNGVVDSSGVAWHLEVALAETQDPGSVVYATNYGVSFDDPLGGTDLITPDIFASGTRSFLVRCDAIPGWDNDRRRAAVVHVTCAAPPVLDKGKVRLVVPGEVAEVFAKVLWLAGKELHRDARSAERAGERARASEHRALEAADRAERAATAAERRQARAEEKARRATDMSVKDAVFAVIGEAVQQVRAGTDLPFSSHSLFYKIRPLALKLLPPGTTLKAQYVEQTLIPAYERDHGRIRGMYREPRGEMHEPHHGKTVPLGTLQVEMYQPPEWTYNKVLVVEKAGLRPVLIESGIGDEYDMAIASCDGFGSEATRTLLAKLRGHDMTVFVLHDADHSGYNIALTLAEETARMPEHRIDIVDLGLTVADAVERGLEPEPYVRQEALPVRLGGRLTETEQEWFNGTVSGRDNQGKPNQWDCRRVELNAFSSPELVSYVKSALEAADAPGKVIPPGRMLRRHAWSTYDTNVATRVESAIAGLLNVEQITRDVQRIARRRARMKLTPRIARRRLRAYPRASWRNAAAAVAEAQLHLSGVDFDRLVRRLVMDRISELDDNAAPEALHDD
jgi:hypothetical protein